MATRRLAGVHQWHPGRRERVRTRRMIFGRLRAILWAARALVSESSRFALICSRVAPLGRAASALRSLAKVPLQHFCRRTDRAHVIEPTSGP